jgi:hypothetical protein
MGIQFDKVTRHGKFELMPGVVYGFEDEDAEPYFTELGWAKKTPGKPVRIFSKDEIDIDPLTVRASNGKHVMPERANAELKRREKLRDAGTPVEEQQVTIRPKG